MKYKLVSAAVVWASAACCGQGVPGMATGILEQTSQARDAISKHDKAAAMDHIRGGIALADNIKRQSPSSAEPIMVPVARDVTTTTTWTPVKRGKDGEMSARRYKRNTSVREVDQKTTTSLLDVTSARDRLAAARSALEQDDWNLADASLAAIPQSIVHSQTDATVPLLKVRENLELAKSRILERKYHDAAAPLRAAAEALSGFERLFPGPDARQAEIMRLEILDYAKHVGSRHADALERIELWLDPVQQWNRAVAR